MLAACDAEKHPNATESVANQGITDPAQLVALSTSARREGISTSTIGFGQEFDEDLLTGMADAGGAVAWPP